MTTGRAEPTLAEWLREGPFSLALSAGFFGFFAHAGFLTALEDAGLLPDPQRGRMTGASAGALVSGAWASGVDAKKLADVLLALERKDFWDPRPGVGLLRGALFRARLESILPARTFAECRVPLAVSVYDVLHRRVRALDRGSVAQAIHASCAVPLMFHPVWIEGRPYVDGGVTDRAGLAGMPRGDRVLFHFLASRLSWRKAARSTNPWLSIPPRANMTTVVVNDIPRVGPFRLGAGARAFDVARRAMKRALASRVDGAVLRA